MLIKIIKIILIIYLFLLVFCTIIWNHRPTLFVNADYKITTPEDITSLDENALYVSQHVSRMLEIEQMILCEDIKKSKIKFNIVSAITKTKWHQFFKTLPIFTVYDLIHIKWEGNSGSGKKIEDKLLKERENVLIFLSKTKKSKGIYHILKKTKKPLVLINMHETKNRDKFFNKTFGLEYRIIKDYPIEKSPEDFMEWLKSNLYNHYEKLEKKYTEAV